MYFGLTWKRLYSFTYVHDYGAVADKYNIIYRHVYDDNN